MLLFSAYGSEAGSAAIKWIPTGGLFVTGGLTPKNIKHIEGKNSEFMKAYYDKGRVSTILDSIPLFAVMVEDLGVR
jgi:glucokinase